MPPSGKISTHTLTWSVTRHRRRNGDYSGNFNSHAHVERDEIRAIILLALSISTHTLTWSVTSMPIEQQNAVMNFNSHAHVERDELRQVKCKLLNDFNSHAHVERD